MIVIKYIQNIININQRMTDKEHDVNYADPEEESKGTFEQKVRIYSNYISSILLINIFA